jgi:hypothetical protein
MSNCGPKLEKRNSKIASWASAVGARVSNFELRFSNLLACIPWRIVLGAGAEGFEISDLRFQK